MPDRDVQLHQFAGPKAPKRIGSSLSLQGTCCVVISSAMGPLPGVSVNEKGGQSSDRDLDLLGVIFDIVVVLAVDEHEDTLWDPGLANRFRSRSESIEPHFRPTSSIDSRRVRRHPMGPRTSQ